MRNRMSGGVRGRRRKPPPTRSNFKVYPITMRAFDESFGFTDEEVQKMLTYYGLEEDYEIVKA